MFRAHEQRPTYGSASGLQDETVPVVEVQREFGAVREQCYIVLDVKLDGLAWNALPSLRRWAARQQGLVAVVALERHGFGGGSCSAVEVLPGRKFEPASESLLALLDVCDAGHLHYAPLNDLLGITRALYRLARADDPPDAERLRALAAVGATLRGVLAAATTHPGTIAHQNAWEAAERAIKALGELVASTPFAPLVAATGLRISRPRRTMG